MSEAGTPVGSEPSGKPKVITVDGDKIEALAFEILQTVGSHAAKHGLKPPEVVLALATATARVIEFAEKTAVERAEGGKGKVAA